VTHPSLSIILPVHNQADHLREVVLEYLAALAKVPNEYEIILTPNACQDGSLAIAQSLAQEYPTVSVVQSDLGGWGRAVRLGLSAARGQLLCYTNLARTSAQELTLLLLYASVYPDVVVKANRKIRENWRRRLGSLLYNLECRALFDLSYWDINGTPKVFPRAFDKLLRLTREDDLIDAEFSLICRTEGYPLVEVPIFSYRRHGGKSTTNYYSAARMYWGAYQMWRERQAQRR
jgi:glycosyltransferase involved in cell wall biosynthesis